MNKILLIVILLAVLLYFLSRRIMMRSKTSTGVQRSNKQGYYLIDLPAQVAGKAIKSTMYSAGIGAVLLVITVLLAIKIKILFFLLPISFYLIGQLFLLNNHMKYAKNQRIWYNPQSKDVWVEWLSGNQVHFKLDSDLKSLKAVKAVQKNQGMLYGYYELGLAEGAIFIPFLMEESQLNQRFFQDLKLQANASSKSSLFPMI
ncbi:hypothetical protein [Sphingobacterium humi]|uniref:Uncharacterized protein n=1 Tax=Sphingobacterium humi TaxID=1796905 RepID=A0A6N8KWR9_9SPHI|nr:hypothetical protein [Sphingobacterium humi]MVZ61526.1 hypothetical protein [Sphingobacterium humi]